MAKMTYVLVRADVPIDQVALAFALSWESMECDAANEVKSELVQAVTVSNEKVLLALIAEAVLNTDWVSAANVGEGDDMVACAAVIGPTTGCGPMLKELADGNA